MDGDQIPGITVRGPRYPHSSTVKGILKKEATKPARVKRVTFNLTAEQAIKSWQDAAGSRYRARLKRDRQLRRRKLAQMASGTIVEDLSAYPEQLSGMNGVKASDQQLINCKVDVLVQELQQTCIKVRRLKNNQEEAFGQDTSIQGNKLKMTYPG